MAQNFGNVWGRHGVFGSYGVFGECMGMGGYVCMGYFGNVWLGMYGVWVGTYGVFWECMGYFGNVRRKGNPNFGIVRRLSFGNVKKFAQDAKNMKNPKKSHN